MQRVLTLVFVLVVTAASAQAASISVAVDYLGSTPEDPAPGDTFQLTVTATANAGETDNIVFGRLVFTGSNSITGGAVQQFPLVTLGTLVWLTGPVGCTGQTCDVFGQVPGVTPLPVSNTPFTIATVTFQLGSIGTLSAHWDTTTPGAEFDFFGAPTPPDVCIIGPECPIIPEPATGALLAIGLSALATGARRRTR